jgi:cbb3-type cytochrome oxidase maturation protein
MTVIAFLIPIAIGLGLLGLLGFLWAVQSGQYDDPNGAASRILIDDGDLPLP